MIAVVVITILYIILIIFMILGFKKTPIFKSSNVQPQTKFSIIIAFRNEEHNLENLLTSLIKIRYPLSHFEIILVDDFSSDDSHVVIQKFKKKHPEYSIQLFNNSIKSSSPKKDAIYVGIANSSYDWIVTTDADCEVPPNWLLNFDSVIQLEAPFFIAAPVKFSQANSLLYHFQNLNFLSLIGATIGAFGVKKPILCNGANLCYSKQVFFKVNGFKGNNSIASGDDVFLLEKIAKIYPQKITYLKSNNSIVITKPENSFSDFMNQQIRWVSKASSYKSFFSIFVGLLVFSINLAIVFLSISLIYQPENWKLLVGIYLQKMLFDTILIEQTATFLKAKPLKYLLISSILYPFFSLIISFLALTKKYKWKGRYFKK